jgi:hypothetical protein
MSLTVAGIAADVSVDIRQVLLPSNANDLGFLTGWIDRVHKDLLHSSLYSYLNLTTTNFLTVKDQQTYVVDTGVAARRIVGMYDQTRDRLLFPLEKASSPVSQTEKQETNPGQIGGYQAVYSQPPGSAQSLQSGQAEYFRHLPNSSTASATSITFSLYPIPKQVVTFSVSTENQVDTVAAGDPLLLPEDARDMMVAGVNFYANLFLKRSEEAQMWMQVYEKLRKGESLA